MVSNQTAVVNVYAPAWSQDFVVVVVVVVDELACVIKDINVDYILVCGDFNYLKK